MVPIRIENTGNGMSALETDALKAVRPGVTPVVDRTLVDPDCLPSGGGGSVTLIGSGLTDKSAVTIGGLAAPVYNFSGAPDEITVISPKLAPGPHDIVVVNQGGATTVPSAVTVYDRDLGAAATETDNNDQIIFAWQTGFNPDKFASYLTFRHNWSNADTGITTVDRWNIRGNQPTVSQDMLSADLFRGLAPWMSRLPGRR